MNLEQLANKMQHVRTQLDEAKSVATAFQKEWDHLRKVEIPDKMEELGLESARVSGVGTLSLTTDAYCSCPSDNKYALQEWMIAHEFKDLITEVINGSTLKAWYKEQLKAGNPLPDELVKFDPYTYAKITK